MVSPESPETSSTPPETPPEETNTKEIEENVETPPVEQTPEQIQEQTKEQKIEEESKKISEEYFKQDENQEELRKVQKPGNENQEAAIRALKEPIKNWVKECEYSDPEAVKDNLRVTEKDISRLDEEIEALKKQTGTDPKIIEASIKLREMQAKEINTILESYKNGDVTSFKSYIEEKLDKKLGGDWRGQEGHEELTEAISIKTAINSLEQRKEEKKAEVKSGEIPTEEKKVETTEPTKAEKTGEKPKEEKIEKAPKEKREATEEALEDIIDIRHNEIFDKAGEHLPEILFDKIKDLEAILKFQKEAGKGKLKDKISDIREGPDGDKAFIDESVAYLPKKGEAIFVGDIHGDAEAVKSIVKQNKFIERMEKGEKDISLVFLGDYADRGTKNIATVEEIATLKLLYPENVVLIRGDHEETKTGEHYGLLGSFVKKYGEKEGEKLFQKYNEMTEEMPGIVVTGNGIVGVHGGIPSQEINSLKDLNNQKILKEMRWNDPSENIDERTHNSERDRDNIAPNLQIFGQKPFERFMEKIGGEKMIRSHEAKRNGKEELFDGKLTTIFSNGSKKSESSHYSQRVNKAVFAKTQLDQEKPSLETVEVSYEKTKAGEKPKKVEEAPQPTTEQASKPTEGKAAETPKKEEKAGPEKKVEEVITAKAAEKTYDSLTPVDKSRMDKFRDKLTGNTVEDAYKSLENLDKAIKDTDKEEVDLNKELQKIEGGIKKNQGTIDGGESRLKEYEEHTRKLSGDIADERIEKARDRVEKQKEKLEKDNEERQKKKEEIEEKIENLKTKREEYEAKRKEAMEKVEGLVVEKIAGKGSEIDKHREILQPLKEQVEKRKSEIKNREEDIKKAREFQVKLKKDDPHDPLIKSMEEDIRRSKKGLGDLRNELGKTRKEEIKSEKRIRKLEGGIGKLATMLSEEKIGELLEDQGNWKWLINKIPEKKRKNLIESGVLPSEDELIEQGFLSKKSAKGPTPERKTETAKPGKGEKPGAQTSTAEKAKSPEKGTGNQEEEGESPEKVTENLEKDKEYEEKVDRYYKQYLEEKKGGKGGKITDALKNKYRERHWDFDTEKGQRQSRVTEVIGRLITEKKLE